MLQPRMTVLSQQAGWKSKSVQIHCVTRRKQTASKTTVINQTSAAGRQMAGCTCVFFFPETAVTVILAWRQFPRCCLLGHSGHSSLVVHRRGPRKKKKRSHGCVYLRSGVGASLQVYVSCHALVKAAVCSKSPAAPQSSWHGERQRESAWSQSSPHTDAFLSYRRPADAKIKQKERCLYLFVYSSFACQISTRWQMAKSTTAARRERTNVSSGAAYLTSDVIIILCV